MKSGINIDQIDRGVRPQDDLYGFANGTWLRETEIPADKPGIGTFVVLGDIVEERAKAILEDASGDTSPEREEDWRKIGDLYRSFMDVERIEAVGGEPLVVPLQQVAAVENTEQLVRLMGALQREGVGGLIAMYVGNDEKAPDVNVVYLRQDGLSLPDESYYREEQYAPQREAFVAHVDRLMALAGWQGADLGARLLATETAVARHHWDVVACRDVEKMYNSRTAAELREQVPGFPWDAWAEGLRAEGPVLDRVVIGQLSYVEAVPGLLAELGLEDLKLWLAYRVVNRYAGLLSQDFVTETWDFYSRTLAGSQEQRDRWKRGISYVTGCMSEALGKVYAGRHFTQAHKDRMLELVDNLIAAFRQSFEESEWLTEETKARAYRKLETFTPKIGFPDEWRDYSRLEVSPDDVVGNARRSAEFETDREMAKIGQPVDRGEWFMPVHMVNAYYNPPMNEIVFPAGILQPPFFDVEADDAVNYGGIGSVIGHEIGHGFDDQGSMYDETGRLADWWTDADRAAFQERADRLIAQFDGLRTRRLPDAKVNGALTVGENIGDIGGLAIGYRAYRIACEKHGEMPELDGFTGPQRFFLGWANIWKSVMRQEMAEMLIAVDPHAPADLRGNAVRNLTEFYEAFDVREGDALFVPEEERVRIF